RRSPAKGVGSEGPRGFESHPLRHFFHAPQSLLATQQRLAVCVLDFANCASAFRVTTIGLNRANLLLLCVVLSPPLGAHYGPAVLPELLQRSPVAILVSISKR